METVPANLVASLGRGLKPGEVRVSDLSKFGVPDPVMIGRSRDKGGAWRCLGYLHLSPAGEFYVAALEVWPWRGVPWSPDSAQISTEDLRRLPLSEWTVLAHSWLAKRARKEARASLRGNRRRRLEHLASSEPPRPGPKGRGRDFYYRLAHLYLELQSEGVTHIQKRIAEVSGRRLGVELTDTQTSDALKIATHRYEFLARGSRGRPGRQPGPNLFTYNEQEEE